MTSKAKNCILSLSFRAHQSEIARWAYSFWLGACNGENMVVALSGYSAYFDASMNAPQDEMMVAGYASTLEEWGQFEIAWKLVLAKYDVPFFKMSEFIGRRKEFAHPKWQSDAYRAQFLTELTQIIRGWTVASVACRMKRDLFDRYNALYELDTRFNMYSLCARDCAAQVRKWVREIPSNLPIAFVFDRGDDLPPQAVPIAGRVLIEFCSALWASKAANSLGVR